MLRFLKDINNRFHAGSGITFHERLVGVVELDEANRNQVLACSSLSGFSLGVCVCVLQLHASCQAWRSYMERHGMSARTAGRDQLVDFIETSEFKEPCLASGQSALSCCLVVYL